MSFTHVFGDDRSIYAATADGSLLWYRDELRDGTNGPNAERGWADGSGNRIGVGWTGFRHLISGGDGIIYAIRESGELHWYRDTLRDGSNGPNAERGWAPGSGNQIGLGWDGFPAVFSTGAGDGIIYAITATTDLLWYRDELRDGTNGAGAERGWAPASGSPIGIGWSIVAPVAVEGYAVPAGVAPGDALELKLSSRRGSSCVVTVLRLRGNLDGSVGMPVGDPTEVALEHRPVSANAWQSGCGWPTTLTVTIDPSWPSGLYSARCAVEGEADGDIVFVVRPGEQPGDFLVIANTNCWNAYNGWGGRSNYTVANNGITLSFERPNPETAPSAFAGSSYASNHLTAAEVWLLTWLEDAQYSFDVCSDLDFHRGDPAPDGYCMTYYETAGGGFVFAIASITFGGSLVVDADLQQILRNALDACKS